MKKRFLAPADLARQLPLLLPRRHPHSHRRAAVTRQLFTFIFLVSLFLYFFIACLLAGWCLISFFLSVLPDILAAGSTPPEHQGDRENLVSTAVLAKPAGAALPAFLLVV